MTLLESRERRGRLARIAVCLAILAVLAAAGTAFAATQTIVGQADNTFTQGSYTSDQGSVVQLQVTGSTHNATASATGPDGKPLFRSDTITGGSTPVAGTQYLSAGSYPFVCTVHPGMASTLVVSGNGTPQPRPSATMTILRRSISRVLKNGILVQINTSAKIDDFSLEAKLGNATIAKSTGLALAAGQVFEVLPLNKAGKGKLRKRSKATVTVTGDIAFGAPAIARAKLK